MRGAIGVSLENSKPFKIFRLKVTRQPEKKAGLI